HLSTQESGPEKNAADMEWKKGSGSAFADGFTRNVRVEGDKERADTKENVHGVPISLPFKVHAELTSNPKEMEPPDNAQLDSELGGLVTEKHDFEVTHFRLREKPFPNKTSTSYLELTDPEAAKKALLEYDDVV